MKSTSYPAKSIVRAALVIAVASLLSATQAQTKWQPVPDKMLTTWGRGVKPSNAWREYPRPQFEREHWQNLNGLWDYAITARDAAQPAAWQGKILVPFAVESTLSGVGKMLSPDQALWYRQTIKHSPAAGRRTLLNFEAVDYHSTVWVNGQQVGEHIGGNTPFSFDVTGALKKGANEIVVRAWDATGGAQLRGKQTLEPKGIWYTRVSGIWQTVWLEEVPARYISETKLSTAI
jgi:beta-galactosidase/beta-glucuronidase